MRNEGAHCKAAQDVAEKKNAAAAGTRNGAGGQSEVTQLHRDYTHKGTRRAILKAASAISNALILGITGQRVDGLTLIFTARLSEDQKAGIAYAALRSMANEDIAYQVASLALFGTYKGEVAR